MNLKKYTFYLLNISTILVNNCVSSSKRSYSKFEKLNYSPKTTNQNEYFKALYNKKIPLVVCTGPAGTGKTLMACHFAIKNLLQNNIDKIIITRPSVTIDEDLGYLPGNINNKMSPWTTPIFDIFQELCEKKEITHYIKENIIEIAPLGFMQGRTFKNSIIIADEMQNSTPDQMFMLLTRIGNNSKMIITGDLMQTKNRNNGLNDFLKRYKKKNLIDLNINKYYEDNEYNEDNENIENNGIKIIELFKDDIQRSEIVVKINEIYK